MTTPTQSDPEQYSPFGADFPLSFDSFPEPRTMPELWDLSELVPTRQGSPNRRSSADSVTGHHKKDAHSHGSESDAVGSDSPNWQPNRFPETSTIPRRWRFNS